MNWQVYTQLSTLQVQIHWMAALLSMLLGVTIFLRRKGDSAHRFIGRLYGLTMVITAVSAFFIRSPVDGQAPSLLAGFSLIHLLIPYTLLSLFMAIRAIRQGDVRAHRMGMISTYVGGLIIAGAFTFLPGRHMHTFFFGDPVEIQQNISKGLKH